MLYKNRLAECRKSQTGIITHRLPTCFCYINQWRNVYFQLSTFSASLHQVTDQALHASAFRFCLLTGRAMYCATAEEFKMSMQCKVRKQSVIHYSFCATIIA